MTRSEARQHVAQYVEIIRHSRAVSHTNALTILGQERMNRILIDRVRHTGPTEGYIYEMNIVDYLVHPDLHKNGPPVGRRRK